MSSLPLPVRVYLCLLEPTDMRRSFDGLCRRVRDFVGADPLSGDLFVFRSRAAIASSCCTGSATAWRSGIGGSKRARSCFPSRRRLRRCRGRGPWAVKGSTIRATDLAMLLDGVDLASVKRQKRYQRPAALTAQATAEPATAVQ